MKFDFSVPMTFYELLAIILAAVAILIPIVQWVWKKWIMQTKLKYYATGRGILYFNQSGSYMRIDGVVEAERKAATIKKFLVKITREKDNRQLNLSWSSMISPVNQNVVGNYLHTTESAHPFRVESDSVVCAFVEYGDAFDSFGKAFKVGTKELFEKISDVPIFYETYAEAVKFYQALPEYTAARNMVVNEFMWDIGKYMVDIEVQYGKKSKHFYYSFSVGENERDALMKNIDESLLSPLKSAYNVPWNYGSGFVELIER